MLPCSVKAEPLDVGHGAGPGPGPLPAEPFTSGGSAAPQQLYAGSGRRCGPVTGCALDRPGARQEPESSWSGRPREGPGPRSRASEPRQPSQIGQGLLDSGDTLLHFHVCDDLPHLLRGSFACRAWSYRLQRQGGFASCFCQRGHIPSRGGTPPEPRPLGGTARWDVVCCCCMSAFPQTWALPKEHGVTGCSTEVGLASCCWCMVPGPCRGLLPAQFRDHRLQHHGGLCALLLSSPVAAGIASAYAAVLGAAHRRHVAAMLLETTSVQWTGSALPGHERLWLPGLLDVGRIWVIEDCSACSSRSSCPCRLACPH